MFPSHVSYDVGWCWLLVMGRCGLTWDNIVMVGSIWLESWEKCKIGGGGGKLRNFSTSPTRTIHGSSSLPWSKSMVQQDRAAPHSWRFMAPNWSITRKNSRNAGMNNSRCSVNWLNSPLADPPTVCPGTSLTLNEIEVINSERVWGKDGLPTELVGINIGNTTLDTVWTSRYSASGNWEQSQSTSTDSYGKTLLLNVCENCHSQYFFLQCD